MSKVVRINKDTQQGVTEFLRFLLKSEKVKGVFVLKKINNDGAVAYSLITKPDRLDDIVPFFPLMPVNAGKLLSRFTLKGGVTEPVAAVLKPCELRAFIELVKREQGNIENILVISPTCGGVYPLKMATADGAIEKNLSKYWDTVKKGEILTELRSVCRGCEEFVPYTSDITVDVMGNKDLDKQCVLFLNTERAEEIVEGMTGEIYEKELDGKKIDAIRGKREREKEKLFGEIDKKLDGLNGLVELFGRCIGCHGCSKVCPICYCKLCEFESPESEYKPSNYEAEVKKRGGLKVPPETIYYQLGRMTHVGISCVGCGSCEDVCPVNIPLAIIFKKIGESVQKMFGYIPGANVSEEIPLITFEKEEFAEIEE